MKLRHCVWGMIIIPALLYSQKTDACSCAGPGPGFLSHDGVLPANARGMVFSRPWTSFVDDKGKVHPHLMKKFKVERIEKNARIPVVFSLENLGRSLFVRTKRQMEAEARYGFSYNRCSQYYRDGEGKLIEKPCLPDWLTVEITIGKERLDNQKSPAKLVVGPLVSGKTMLAGGAGCHWDVGTVSRSLELVLPPLAEKYKQALLFETFVDGKPWHPESHTCNVTPAGRSWMGLGKDLLYSICEHRFKETYQFLERQHKDFGTTLAGVSKGTHKVRMTATLPGVGVIADTGEVEVEIGCK